MFTSRDNQDIIIIFRYDDYSSESSILVEKEILNTIEKNKISCSFGVIPFAIDSANISATRPTPLSNTKIEMIRDFVSSGTIEICQHGYMHESITTSEPKSEFQGLSYENQIRLISSGKQKLESIFEISVKTFIPPWNTYDINTLRALSKLGFTILSADNTGDVNKLSSLNYIPFTITISELRDCLNSKKLPTYKNNAFLVLMLHDYDFREINSENGIIDINGFINTIEEAIDNYWKIVSVREATEQFDFFSPNSYQYNRFKLRLLDHLTLLKIFGKIFNKFDLLKTFYISGYLIIKLLALVIIYYFLISFAIFELVIMIANKIQFKMYVSKVFGIICLIGFITISILSWIDDKILGRNELSLLIIGLGFWAGISVYFLRLKKLSVDNDS